MKALFENIMQNCFEHRKLILCVFVAVITIIIIAIAHKHKIFNNLKKIILSEKKKLSIGIKIKFIEFIEYIQKLYAHNFLIIIWYFIIFFAVLIANLFCWQNFTNFDLKSPCKESILLLWLIILSIIPFGNCEIFGFKFNSNGSLNNINPSEISQEESKQRKKMIEEYKKELETMNKQNGEENV